MLQENERLKQELHFAGVSPLRASSRRSEGGQGSALSSPVVCSSPVSSSAAVPALSLGAVALKAGEHQQAATSSSMPDSLGAAAAAGRYAGGALTDRAWSSSSQRHGAAAAGKRSGARHTPDKRGNNKAAHGDSLARELGQVWQQEKEMQQERMGKELLAAEQVGQSN